MKHAPRILEVIELLFRSIVENVLTFTWNIWWVLTKYEAIILKLSVYRLQFVSTHICKIIFHGYSHQQIRISRPLKFTLHYDSTLAISLLPTFICRAPFPPINALIFCVFHIICHHYKWHPPFHISIRWITFASPTHITPFIAILPPTSLPLFPIWSSLLFFIYDSKNEAICSSVKSMNHTNMEAWKSTTVDALHATWHYCTWKAWGMRSVK